MLEKARLHHSITDLDVDLAGARRPLTLSSIADKMGGGPVG